MVRLIQYTGKSLWDFNEDDFAILLDGFRALGQPVLDGGRISNVDLLRDLNPRDIVEGNWGKRFTPLRCTK